MIKFQLSIGHSRKLLGKAKRYGYIFIWYVGDHQPLHIHAYKNGKLECKWMLNEEAEMFGTANSKIKKAIKELRNEGCFRSLEDNNEH